MDIKKKTKIANIGVFISLILILFILFIYGNTLEKNNEIINGTIKLKAKRTYVNVLLQNVLYSDKDLYTAYKIFSNSYIELQKNLNELINLPFFSKILINSDTVQQSRRVLFKLMDVDNIRLKEIDNLLKEFKKKYQVSIPGPYNINSKLHDLKGANLYQITVKLKGLTIYHGGAWDMSFEKMVKDITIATKNQKTTIEYISIVVIFILIIIVMMSAKMFNQIFNELQYNKKKLLEKERQNKELEIAKNIQMSLLPDIKSQRNSDYEIITNMTPAEEVGGDYYDLIKTDLNKYWMAIGDVSGHGLISGLIMMMTQTCIRNIVNLNLTIDPADVLVAINKTVSHNIKQLCVDNYMTLTLFAVCDEGKLIYSGLHQDILIYRSNDKSVEIVETHGFWIGTDDPLHKYLKNDEFHLEIGDTILLFTDGITEAISENDREMFGQSKLIEILNKNGEKEPEYIKGQLLKELENYIFDDDFTFIICKRLN